MVTNALADFGETALPALLEFVDPDVERPSDTYWAGSVSSGLQALRFMVQDGTISAEMRSRVAAVAEAWLTGGPHDHGLVLASMDIAIALGDAGLVSLVERPDQPGRRGNHDRSRHPPTLAGLHRGTRCQPVVGWRLLGTPPAICPRKCPPGGEGEGGGGGRGENGRARLALHSTLSVQSGFRGGFGAIGRRYAVQEPGRQASGGRRTGASSRSFPPPESADVARGRVAKPMEEP